MNGNGQAELRIFTGIHAGARARLAPGIHVLGSAPECDLIVCDPGVAKRHLELHIGDSGWLIHPLQPCNGVPPEGMQLVPGAGVALDAVIMSVDAVNAPWQYSAPAIDPSLGVISEAENDEKIATGDEPRDGEAFIGEANLWSNSPVDASSEHPSEREVRGARLLRIGGAAIVFIVMAALAVLFVVRHADEDVVSERLAASNNVDTRKAQIAYVIDTLNLTSRANIEQRPDGSLVVNATLVGEDEYEALAAALSQLNPRPGLKVATEETVIDAIRDALALRYPDVRVERLGSGRFRLTGCVNSDADRDALPANLLAEFPGALGFENNVLTPTTMAESLVARLRENSITISHAAWQDSVFFLKADVPLGQILRMKQMLARIDAEYGQWLKFAVEVTGKEDNSKNVQESLPFRIRGVVGGEMPYIVLPDNTKIVPGGRIGAWRLVEIGDEHLVFDGPSRIIVGR